MTRPNSRAARRRQAHESKRDVHHSTTLVARHRFDDVVLSVAGCPTCRAPCARTLCQMSGQGSKLWIPGGSLDRPRTLCFECLRLEIVRRQETNRQTQRALPLEDTIDLRRRRAQIAARRTLGIWCSSSYRSRILTASANSPPIAPSARLTQVDTRRSRSRIALRP